MFMIRMYLNGPKIHEESKDRPWPKLLGPPSTNNIGISPKNQIRSNPTTLFWVLGRTISLVGSRLCDYEYTLYPPVILVARLWVPSYMLCIVLCVCAFPLRPHPVWVRSYAIVVVSVQWTKSAGRQIQAAADL